jgi:hypothetical protein
MKQMEEHDFIALMNTGDAKLFQSPDDTDNERETEDKTRERTAVAMEKIAAVLGSLSQKPQEKTPDKSAEIIKGLAELVNKLLSQLRTTDAKPLTVAYPAPAKSITVEVTGYNYDGRIKTMVLTRNP